MTRSVIPTLVAVTLFVALLSFWSFGPVATSQEKADDKGKEKPKAAVAKYEYRVVQLYSSDETSEKTLNIYASDGWELAGTISPAGANVNTMTAPKAILKREKK